MKSGTVEHWRPTGTHLWWIDYLVIDKVLGGLDEHANLDATKLCLP